MTTQDIEKLKALCEKEGFELDFISRSTQGAMDIFRVEKKEEPIRVNISAYDLCHSNDMRIRFSITKERSKSFDWDNEELTNHIEESIEAFLNRKP